MLFRLVVQLRHGKSTIAPKVEVHARISLSVLRQKRFHEVRHIARRIHIAASQFGFQQIARQPVVTKKRMVPVPVVMGVERFPFLFTEGLKEGGIDIEKQHLRARVPVDPFSHLSLDVVELIQRVFVHSVVEA